jgi:hypothetical protein
VVSAKEWLDMMEGDIHDLEDCIKEVLESTDFEQHVQDLVQD